jgi:hypothetical protein
MVAEKRQGMDQDAAAWSAEEIAAFIQQMSRASVEQFVRKHQHLRRIALAGYSKQLPKDYPQRLARVLAQHGIANQQALRHLLERWRQDHPAVCQAIQQLELPLHLEMLQPLIEQYGGQDLLSALRTDPRAEKLREVSAALKQEMELGKISREATLPAPGEASAHNGKAEEPPPVPPAAEPAEVSSPLGAERGTQTRARPGNMLPKLAPPTNGTGTRPQTVAGYVSALESQVQALAAIEQTVTTWGMQLTQPSTVHNPLAVQRVIEKVTAANSKLTEGLGTFAALERELLETLRGEVQRAEAAGMVEALSAQLPTEPAVMTSDEAQVHLQMIQGVRERLSAALARYEQRRAALSTAPVVIARLLEEIEGLEGETGPLRSNLAGLKAMIAERANDQQTERTERALKRAEQIQDKAIQLRDTNLENGISKLRRACRDAETLLNQSLHLSTDLPEVANLQQTLEQARSLLATPLPFKQPQPLPFPPAQIIACYAALRQQNDRLRQALAAYNPQIALATLEDFEQMGNAPSSPQQLREIGAALVGAASLASGYSGLIWRVGSKLLMMLENTDAEQFYERYGFAAVATGLAASLRAGDFPLGLAFAEHLFYTGADVASVFAHPRVLETLSEVCASTQLPRVASDCFAQASPAIRKAALAFLTLASEINLPQPLYLQLSAALLTTATTPEERAQAGQVFIQALLGQEQRVNAYCVWRALAQEQPDLYSNSVGLETLYRLVWWLTLDTHAPVAQLATLCSDSTLQQEGFVVPGIALALCLGSLVVARAPHPQGEELVQLYAEMLRGHHYPSLSDMLLAQLPGYDYATARDAAPGAAAREQAIRENSTAFAAALAEADRRIQVSNYRFAPTKQMRNQIDARLKGVLAALQEPEELHDELVQSLMEDAPDDIARALIEQEEKSRRQLGFESIEGDDLKKLRKDLENVAAHLSLAAQKRTQLLELGVNLHSIKRSSGGLSSPQAQEAEEEAATEWHPKDEALLAELHRILLEVPQARHLLQRALPLLPLELP